MKLRKWVKMRCYQCISKADKKIREIAKETERIFFDEPTLTYKQALEKAKGMILNEDTSLDKIKKAN